MQPKVRLHYVNVAGQNERGSTNSITVVREIYNGMWALQRIVGGGGCVSIFLLITRTQKKKSPFTAKFESRTIWRNNHINNYKIPEKLY